MRGSVRGVLGFGGHRRRVQRPPDQESRREQRHAERRPLRSGERTEALVDAERVLQDPRAAVHEPEREGDDALASRTAQHEEPEEREESPRDDHVVQGRLMDPRPLRDQPPLTVQESRPGALDRLEVPPLQSRLTQAARARERGRDRAAPVPPRQRPRGGPPEVVPDDEIADATDRDPEREGRRDDVGHLEEAVAASAHPRHVDQGRPRDAAQQRDAAPPHREHLPGVVELGEMRQHVEEPRADDRADQRPEGDRVDLLGGDAARGPDLAEEPCSAHEPDRDEQPVRRDREGTEADAIEDRPADGGEEEHRTRVYPRCEGHILATARPISRPAATSDG